MMQVTHNPRVKPVGADELECAFEPEARAAGEGLYREGKVRLVEGSTPAKGRAKVAFFRRFHDVMVERTLREVVHDCTCAHFENTGTGCAHLWGLLLALKELADERARAAEPAKPALQPWFVIGAGGGSVSVQVVEETKAGLVPALLDREGIDRIADAGLRAAALALRGIAGGEGDDGGLARPKGPWPLAGGTAAALLRRLTSTGRTRLESATLAAEPGAALDLVLAFRAATDSARLQVTGELAAADGSLRPLTDALLIPDARDPVLVIGHTLHPLRNFGAAEWPAMLQRQRGLSCGINEWQQVLKDMQAHAPLPRLLLPGEAAPLPILDTPPTPRMTFTRGARAFTATADSLYGTVAVAAESALRLVTDLGGAATRRPTDTETASTIAAPAQYLRHAEQEAGHREEAADIQGLMEELGTTGLFDVAPTLFDSAAQALLQRGWRLRLDGRPVRRAQKSALRLEAEGTGWRLAGEVGCDDGSMVPLAGAVKAANERRFLDLGADGLLLVDGDIAERLAGIFALGGGERMSRAQALLLEPLLDSEAGSAVTLRGALAKLTQPDPVPVPAALRAELRPYQQEGLAWLAALAREDLGGVLADDMGLGKTVQVLALLLHLRAAAQATQAKQSTPADQANQTAAQAQLAADTEPAAQTAETTPSNQAAPTASAADTAQPRTPVALVVAPASLLWNWEAETARFAPELKTHRHHGASRDIKDTTDADIILTTYATLQRDAEDFAGRTLDLLVLDEAQAIRNPATKSAEAVRRIEAKLRLALTGTPVENSPRDLWAILDAVNPGILGEEKRFLAALRGEASPTFAASIARAVKPFLLRRRRDVVLKDLPELTQQVIHAEPETAQRQLMQRVLNAARKDVLTPLEQGQRANTFTVLEALLRLRQAACHPGLVDATLDDEPSGKVEALVEELEEVLAAGHAALVFSQFTSFLDRIEKRLARANVRTARLDGKTPDREGVVRAFNAPDGAPVLLTSLKVGGTGLNLVRASYVFLMDPWWNPAVEAQAVGRAHRLGQERPVLVQRFVTRGSIEERILELQERKRAIAEALLSPEGGSTAGLDADDLRWLFALADAE